MFAGKKKYKKKKKKKQENEKVNQPAIQILQQQEIDIHD